jgi:hypothetical protein
VSKTCVVNLKTPSHSHNNNKLRALLPTMRYQRCKVDELKAFAAARHIDVAYKRLKKSIIIDILKKADKSRPFHRFLDLPREIRNMIYEYSLKVLPGQTTCHPQILATCKQINREASGFLYDDNVTTIEIFSDRVETCGVSVNSSQSNSPRTC